MDKPPRYNSLVDSLFDGDLPKDQPELVAAAGELPAPTSAYEKPVSEMNNLEFRYIYATRIRAKIHATYEDFKLQAIHVSTILQVPEETLEPGGCLDHQKEGYKLRSMLENVAMLVSHYLLKFREDRSESDDDCVGPTATRHNNQKKACRERGGDAFRCVFTGTSPGEVAHIIPLAWNSNEVNIATTERALHASEAFFSETTCGELIRLLRAKADPGSSDRTWNIVTINECLHSYWSRAYWGLKCLGINPKALPRRTGPDKVPDALEMEVKIQFQWLHRRWGKPTDEMDITVGRNSMENMAELQIKHVQRGCPPPTHHPDGGMIGAVHVTDNVPLISGHTFILTMPAEDAAKCKMVLDLQWAVIGIAAMSGGAEYPELLPNADDYYAMMQGMLERWTGTY